LFFFLLSDDFLIDSPVGDNNNDNDATMNEVDFDVSRLPALRKAKPEVTAAAASSRHSQFELEGKLN
jgi:hypothetical protein